jgi:hypothetical protein
MSAVFRRDGQDAIEASASWTLVEQIRDVSCWLQHAANAELVHGYVLDIGFNSRLDGVAVAVQGETIPVAFMRQLAALDIDLWLSIYPPFEAEVS